MSAKAHVKAIASAMFKRAADAHVQGMRLAKRGARIDQLGGLATEEQAQQVLDTLVESDVVCCKNGVYELLEDEFEVSIEDVPNIPLTNKNIGKA